MLHDVTPQIAAPLLLSSRAPVGRRPSIFWRLPFRLTPFVTWNMKSHSNLKTLGVRDDETHEANPRPRLPGWARFTLGVSSREKNNRLDRNLNALGYPELIWWLCWREGYEPEDEFWKTKRIQGLLGFRCWVFLTGTWATKDTLLFLVYERLDSESPQQRVNLIPPGGQYLGFPSWDNKSSRSHIHLGYVEDI
jgi:hypothetical protein